MFIDKLLCNDLLLSSGLIVYFAIVLPPPIGVVHILLIFCKALYRSSKVIKLSGQGKVIPSAQWYDFLN